MPDFDKPKPNWMWRLIVLNYWISIIVYLIGVAALIKYLMMP